MLVFNILAVSILLFSILAILAGNPVYAIIFLIFALSSSAGILLFLNVEFLAFIILIVYVGAIAILFLFIIMMLNLTSYYRGLKLNWYNFFSSINLLLITYFFLIYYLNNIFTLSITEYQYRNWIDVLDNYSNIQLIGQILYTDYFIVFVSFGLVLLIAMIGAIVITSGRTVKGKKQLIYQQLTQDYKKNIKFRN